MGKKSKFKKFKRIAAQLPAINTRAVIGETVSGSDAIKMGLESDKGINPAFQYRRKRMVERSLNHPRNMKRAYYRSGLDGVTGYANAVIKFATEQQKQNDRVPK